MRLALRQRLQGARKASPPPAAGGTTAAKLLAGAQTIKKAEAQREAAAAEKRRSAALEELARREPQAWHTVKTLLAEKRWKAHAEAIEQLQPLRDLADYQKMRPAFNRRMKALREQHAARAALLRRFDQAGWQ